MDVIVSENSEILHLMNIKESVEEILKKMPIRPFLFRRRLPMITKNINARYLIIVMIMEVMY